VPVSPSRSTSTRRNVLDAARATFTRYGYRRTSMGQVAREAGLSRAAVYLHFASKEELFRDLASELQDQIFASAREAAASDRSLLDRLVAIFEAKLGAWGALLDATEHGSELTDENNRLCGDISAAAKQRFRRLLKKVLTEANKAGEIDLVAAGVKPEAAVDLILAAIQGIEARSDARTSAGGYRREIGPMLRILVRGLS
jgi:AcrR family transcriptional regulator